jgi:hypothetical protein
MADQAASLTHKAYKFGSSLINVNAASRVDEANLDYQKHFNDLINTKDPNERSSIIDQQYNDFNLEETNDEDYYKDQDFYRRFDMASS